MSILSATDNLLNNIKTLKKESSLIGIKSEFEAEGSSHQDILRLRSITHKANTKLFVKIGGCEAINDIKFLIGINIDGIIVPMIESKFAVWKFISFINKIKIKKLPHLSINIESKNALENLDEILSTSKNKINNITIGRTDFAASYFKKDIYPNSTFITNKIISVVKTLKKNNFGVTVGGSVDREMISIYKKNKLLRKNIDRIETRKIILSSKIFLNNKNSLELALNFEKNYILMKNEINEFTNKSDLERLAILKARK